MLYQVIGTIDGSGKIVLKDRNQGPEDPVPVDLELEKVLGDMPRKTYNFTRTQPQLHAHQLPQGRYHPFASCVPISASHTSMYVTGCKHTTRQGS